MIMFTAMKSKPAIRALISAAWAVALSTPAFVSAQTMDFGIMPPRPGSGESGKRPPLFEVSVVSSYTAQGLTTLRGAKFGDSDAFSLNLGLGGRVPLNEHFIIPLELRSQNLFLDSLIGAPLPGRIHTLQVGTGLGYRVNDRWMVMALVNPTLYKLSDIGRNDFGVSGGIRAMWNYSPSMRFVFGVMFSPDSDLKVLPMAGMDWAINEQFDLRLMFPKPRLTYKVDNQWSLHVGADLNMVTFRTSDTLGTSIGLPQYNDALGTYRDIRIGAGFGYKFTQSIHLEAEAGYSVQRQINYTRIDERVRFDPAPYFRIGLRASF